MKRSLVIFLIILSGVYADKYARLENYYEKRLQVEDSDSDANHFKLKQEFFVDTLNTNNANLKGHGRGWRGNYEYSAPNRPYFSIEGGFSSSKGMDWDGAAVESVEHSMTDKLKGLPTIYLVDQGNPDRNYALYKTILSFGKKSAFQFNSCKYYCEDLIDHKDYIDKVSGEVLNLNNDWITGGHIDPEEIGKHFGRNINKRQGNSYRCIIYNGKKYYRIKKNRFEDKEVFRSSLGSVSKTLADINMKMGTNWKFGNAFMTPFAGIGYHSVSIVESLRVLKDSEKDIVDRHPELRIAGISDTHFASWGARCQYAFSPWFNVGVTGQVNHGLFYNSTGFVPQHDKGLFSLVGYRASTPVSLHLGRGVKYNFEAEPYAEQFNVGKKETNTGVRFSAGVSF